jgi:hypothetical protein
MDEMYFERVQPKDLLTMCPKFECALERFEGYVMCHKQDIDNPFIVKLRNCMDVKFIRDSDFFGGLKESRP